MNMCFFSLFQCVGKITALAICASSCTILENLLQSLSRRIRKYYNENDVYLAIVPAKAR
jgi:hypothetical protein